MNGLMGGPDAGTYMLIVVCSSVRPSARLSQTGILHQNHWTNQAEF